jgi:alpha-glucan,water dikinase
MLGMRTGPCGGRAPCRLAEAMGRPPFLQGAHPDPADAAARIFVWLRYSSTRQLTWQRNYNTQPRILGAAQHRLTHAVADAYARSSGEAQEWVRMCLTTVGRGGNAQVVRDEILNIMHRNKVGGETGRARRGRCAEPCCSTML